MTNATMPKKYFLTWSDIQGADKRQIGDKAWNLGTLSRCGFNVPPGGVLTTRAYDEFIQLNNLVPLIQEIAQVTADSVLAPQTESKLEQLRQKFLQGSFPTEPIKELTRSLNTLQLINKPLAVRSSASGEDSDKASFAGIHESYLHNLGLEQVIQAIKQCYASLWSPRAVAYRRKLNFQDDEVKPAAVVMEMVRAQAAGVGFTCDPQTGRRDLLTINANFGLGESVVSGAVEPDTYYLNAEVLTAPLPILERRIGRKEGSTQVKNDGGTEFRLNASFSAQQALSDAEIQQLGLLLLRVFDALGDGERHQDIEWAFDGYTFMLLQARPVTALKHFTFPQLADKATLWSNGNYRDAIPMVISPLQRRITKTTIDSIQYSFFTASGYPLPEGLQFSRYFNGRLYCDVLALQWAHYDSTGTLPKDFNPFWGGHQGVPDVIDESQDPFQGEAGEQRKQRGKQVAEITMAELAKAPEFTGQVQRDIKAIQSGISQATTAGLLQKYNEVGALIKQFCGKYTFGSSAGSFTVLAMVQDIFPHFGPKTFQLVNELLIGGDIQITSADQGYRLVELAETARHDPAARKFFADAFDPQTWASNLPEDSAFKQAFRNFLQDFGHRAVYELDVSNPRWQEDPAYLLEIIRSTLDTASLGQIKEGQQVIFERAWQEVAQNVPAETLAGLKAKIKQSQEGAALREYFKSLLVSVTNLYRTLAQEIGRRFTLEGLISEENDIFYLTWVEILSILQGEWEGNGAKTLVQERRISRSAQEAQPAPDVIKGETPIFAATETQDMGAYLQGVSASVGQASGPVRLITHPQEGNRLQNGEVMVAPSTDPGWTPLFLRAAALILETGGFLSHGAIVAREYGIPAVVNIPGVMHFFKDGQKVTVDGNSGRVYK